MPPMIGAAIGFMMSDPTPVLHRIGTSAGHHDADRHQLRPQSQHRPRDRRLTDVLPP